MIRMKRKCECSLYNFVGVKHPTLMWKKILVFIGYFIKGVLCPTGSVLHQSLGGRAASTCMKPPPAKQEIPLNKGQVWDGAASEPGKFRAKRTSATSVTGSEKSEARSFRKGRMSRIADLKDLIELYNSSKV